MRAEYPSSSTLTCTVWYTLSSRELHIFFTPNFCVAAEGANGAAEPVDEKTQKRYAALLLSLVRAIGEQKVAPDMTTCFKIVEVSKSCGCFEQVLTVADLVRAAIGGRDAAHRSLSCSRDPRDATLRWRGGRGRASADSPDVATNAPRPTRYR